MRKPTYNNQVDRKKVLNNGQFHKYPARRKKHSINVPSKYQKINQLSASQAFYREAGRKLKQIRASTLQTPGKGAIDSLAGYKKYTANKHWYYDKRAPIPGGNAKLSTGFRRKNKFYKKIIVSYVVFKKYWGFNKKAMNKQYRNTSQSVQRTNGTKRGSLNKVEPFNNRLLMHRDSLFNSTMRKNGLMLNPYQNNIRQFYVLNGKAVRKKNFVQKHANKAYQKDRDFCLQTKLYFRLN